MYLPLLYRTYISIFSSLLWSIVLLLLASSCVSYGMSYHSHTKHSFRGIQSQRSIPMSPSLWISSSLSLPMSTFCCLMSLMILQTSSFFHALLILCSQNFVLIFQPLSFLSLWVAISTLTPWGWLSLNFDTCLHYNFERSFRDLEKTMEVAHSFSDQ